ncbi:hypothetical protein ACFWNL_05595 [Kitasatospora sp. NPDC058397]|uniref:hypothetical protein n=1 Tax=unclassified Kitasatospora TaxID=2633591 RepID=UPI00365E8965
MPLGVDLTRLRSDLGAAPAQVFEKLCVHLFPAILERDFAPAIAGTLLALRPPDGGLEACARLADGRMVGIQAKYHGKLSSALGAVDKSIKSALTHHPDLTDLLVFLPQDLTAGGGTMPGTKQWEAAAERWAAQVHRARPGSPMRFLAYTRSDIERALVSLAEEAIPAYFDPSYLRLSDLHRHAAAAAHTVRHCRGRVDIQSPLLATFLSDTLAELDNPSALANRLAETACALRVWDGWRPALDDLPTPSAGPVTQATQRWTRSDGDRALCAEQLDTTANLLGTESRTDPQSLRRQIDQVLQLCGRAAESITGMHEELMAAVCAAKPFDPLPYVQRDSVGRLLATLDDLQTCGHRLRTVCDDPALAARQTGALLVGGGWGTGKSYGLGGWVQERITDGAPTAFVCGHEFGPGEAFEAQLPLRVSPGTRAHGLRDLLAALQQQALLTGRRAVLAIDALNEVRCLHGDVRTAFASLAELVRCYPLVTLVGTVRMDTRPAGSVGTSETAGTRVHGFLWNPGISRPGQAWRVYQDMYGLPELLLPPDVSELRRPLMLAVLAWCLHRSPQPAPGPIVTPTVGDLFQSWLLILDGDYAAHLDEAHALRACPSPAPPPLVTLACEVLSERVGEEGTLEYRAACQVLADTPGLSDPAVLLRWLENAGVLALDPNTRRVRFAIQRFAEHVRAVNLLRGRRPSRAVARIVHAVHRARDGDPESAQRADHQRMLEALAGATPHVVEGAELSDLVPRRHRSLVAGAVLESLEGRDPKRAGRSSRAFLIRQLCDPGSAPNALYSVLVNATCHKHPLGVEFLQDQLTAWRRSRFERRFAGPIVDLLADPNGIALLRRLVHWAESIGPRGDAVVEEVTSLLLWLSGVGHHSFRDACIRTAADLWVNRPELISRQLTRLGHHRDELVAEATWLAAYGALARSSPADSDHRITDPITAAITRAIARPHLRIHDAVLTVRGVLRPDAIADSAFPAVPLRRPRVAVLPFGSRIIARAASTLSWCPFEEESPRPRQTWLTSRAWFLTLGLPSRLLRRTDAGEFETSSPAVAKALQRAQQEWFAEQATRVLQTASPPDPEEQEEARYCRRAVDPTLGAGWRTRINTLARSENWWTPPFSAAEARASAAGPPAALTEVLIRSDPNGAPWLLLNGLYHLRGDEEPPKEDLPRLHLPPHIIRPTDSWRRASPAHRIPRLPPALRVESHLVPRTALSRALTQGDGVPRRLQPLENWPGHSFLAEYYTRPEFGVPRVDWSVPLPTAVNHPGSQAGPPIYGRFADPVSQPVPSRRLTEALRGHWTGHHLDFTDPSTGDLLLTDPGFAGAGPNAILLAGSAVDRLPGDDTVLLWAVTLVDPGEVRAASWSSYCVLDSGSVHTLPFPGPSTDWWVPARRWPQLGLTDWPDVSSNGSD